MKHPLQAFAVSCLLLLAVHNLAVAADWSLPSNPEAVVVELQFVAPAGDGDPRSDANAERSTLVLRLRRDGWYTVSEQAGKPLVGQLSEAEVQQLLGELVEKQQGLELKSATLSSQIERTGKATGKEWRIKNADTTVVRMNLTGGSHEFRCCAPELLRNRFPQVTELNRVCAIQRRLENLVAMARVGGKPEAERLAALATAEVQRQNGPAVTITAGDLLHVRGTAGDLRLSQFVVEPALRGESGTGVLVSVLETPGRSPQISLTILTSTL